MTIKVRIGDQERDFSAVTESWISEQLRRRRQDGQTVCLRVLINTGSLNLNLSTPGCGGGGGGGGRPPSDREQGIFELWSKRGLNSSDFSPGNVNSFLQQLSRLL